jgi:hypothetical protein
MEVVFGGWFFELVHSKESLTDEKIKAATRQVPQMYEEWSQKRKESLMKAMRSSPCRASVGLCRFDTPYPHSDLEFEAAAAVFHCCGTLSSLDLLSFAFLTFSPAWCDTGKALIGWNEVGSHPGCEWLTDTRHGEVCFSHRGHAAAVSLLRLVNLDPLRTTAEEFDKMELRYFCGYCDSNQSRGIRVMNWRECVSQFPFSKDKAVSTRDLNTYISLCTRSTIFPKHRSLRMNHRTGTFWHRR